MDTHILEGPLEGCVPVVLCTITFSSRFITERGQDILELYWGTLYERMGGGGGSQPPEH